jgi:formylglycine-generating enzyme required for sulfatase activity
VDEKGESISLRKAVSVSFFCNTQVHKVASSIGNHAQGAVMKKCTRISASFLSVAFSISFLFNSSFAQDTSVPIKTPPKIIYSMGTIPAGSFQMGSPGGYRDDRLVHDVTITRSFLMGRTEISDQ